MVEVGLPARMKPKFARVLSLVGSAIVDLRRGRLGHRQPAVFERADIGLLLLGDHLRQPGLHGAIAAGKAVQDRVRAGHWLSGGVAAAEQVVARRRLVEGVERRLEVAQRGRAARDGAHRHALQAVVQRRAGAGAQCDDLGQAGHRQGRPSLRGGDARRVAGERAERRLGTERRRPSGSETAIGLRHLTA